MIKILFITGIITTYSKITEDKVFQNPSIIFDLHKGFKEHV